MSSAPTPIPAPVVLAAPVAVPVPGPAAPFQSASLYVGDLQNEVTESLLFELFNRVGPVASIRVCRDSVTRRSLGYAYVNFHNVHDAERSLDTMNFTEIKSRPCRIMWSQRDPSLRKSGVGNVFVRNLASSVDNKGLYDTFSVFGNILSCKVATDENSVSKGYGYVHFETAEAAQEAIQKFNGTLIDDVEVSVNSFVRRTERAGQADWTNLYVKQFPVTWDTEKVKELFEVYGAVSNVAIILDADGKSKGPIGFVSYAEHESAVKALAELANKSFPTGSEVEAESFELYVNRAQKKGERHRENKTRFDTLNQEKLSKYQGMNLYVKNIGDTLTDDSFREAFAVFGTITSARIMRQTAEPKASKGFGFICYSSPEEATAAVTDMNGKVIGGKPLVVTLHQRKEHRRAHLAATYAPRSFQGMAQPGMGMPPFMGMYMPQGQGYPNPPRGAPGPGGAMGPRGGMPGGMMADGRPGFFRMPPNMYQGALQPGMAGQQSQGGQWSKRMTGQQGGPVGAGFQSGPGGMQQGQGQGGMRRGNMAPQGQNMAQGAMNTMGGPVANRGPNMGNPMNTNRNQMGGYPPQQQGMQQQGGVNRGGPGMGGVKFNNQARNQNGGQQQQMQQSMAMGMPNMQQGAPNPQQMQMQQQMPPNAGGAPSTGKLDFSDAAFASADPLTQKNLIGEKLYPLIHQHQPEQAGKITGMLLEMDNGELLNLIESPDALMSKIDEALHVLRTHKTIGEE
jgi:polyadenylate-binding protein